MFSPLAAWMAGDEDKRLLLVVIEGAADSGYGVVAKRGRPEWPAALAVFEAWLNWRAMLKVGEWR